MSSLMDDRQLADFCNEYGFKQYFESLKAACQQAPANQHGHLPRWLEVLNHLPKVQADRVNLGQGVKFDSLTIDEPQREALTQHLKSLMPWRKGPFDLFGIHIDTEWRSDLKWQRLANKISLEDKRVLDVGCGNGYYMLRMLGSGAKCVLGVDPVAIYVVQFLLMNTYLQSKQVQLLPLGLEAVPDMPHFDTVFSMGVLYHRRDALAHLQKLRSMLVLTGELIIETLVLAGEDDSELIPSDRYAGMKNVWSVPTVKKLENWLIEAGFTGCELLDLTQTTTSEQRQTEWMTSYSLNQFLDPNDHNFTVEGHPAPLRAMIKCKKL